MISNDFKTKNIKDDYRFDAILGEGAFGCGIEATKLDNDQTVEITMYKKDVLDPQEAANLTSQIAALHKLNHPNVVEMIEVYDNENAYYVVMEYMDGGELFDMITEQECYSENLLANTIRPCIDAMRYCHGQGIAHGDLKVSFFN